MQTGRRAVLPALAIIAFGAASPAQAHPHVWIEMQSDVVFNDQGLISGVKLTWTFDEGYAQVALDGLDKNGNGTYDPEELEPLTRENLESLKDYGYFTHLRVNGTETIFDRVEKFSTTVDKGELVFIFDLILPEPLDLRSTKTQLSLYDPSIYVDIVLGGEKPLVMQGIDAGKCNWSFASGEDIANENGMLTPQVVKLSCG